MVRVRRPSRVERDGHKQTGAKMTDFTRQSNWIQHLNRTKSIRLRGEATAAATAAQLQPATVNLHLRDGALSINQTNLSAAHSNQPDEPQQHRAQAQEAHFFKMLPPDCKRHETRPSAALTARKRRAETRAPTSGNHSEISTPKIGPRARWGPKSMRRMNQQQASLTLFGRSTFGQPIVSVGLVSLILASGILLCNCDTAASGRRVAASSARLSDNAPPEPIDRTEVSNQKYPQQNRDRDAIENQQRRRSGSDEASSSWLSSSSSSSSSSLIVNKDKSRDLPRAAAENIERQHLMKLTPNFRSFARARPSKFDSDSESLQASEVTSSASAAARIHTRSSSSQRQQQQSKKPVMTLEDIMNQHYGGAGPRKSASAPSASIVPRPSSGSASGEAERELRQIMMLHEQAATAAAGKRVQSAANTASSTSGAPQGQEANLLFAKHLGKKLIKPILDAATSGANTTGASSKFWTLAAAQPLLAAESTKANTGKMLSSVLSYLASPIAVASSPVAHRKQHNFTNSFTPRTSAKSFLVAPLLGLGQILGGAPDAPPTSGGKSPKAANKYSMPLGGAGTGVSSLENQAAYVLSNAINQPQGYSSNLKGPARGAARPSGEQQGQDLSAEASGLSAVQSAAPSLASAAATNQQQQKQQQQSTGNGHGGVGGWLKGFSANQLAQSYLQNSFRDLLTLTQLPLPSSAGPVSTAPSELEPGGKKYTGRVLGSSQVPGNKANRTALALDDLFRYAYILGNLGVRRKRDPLKALGSTPSMAVVATGPLMQAAASANRKPLLTDLRKHWASGIPRPTGGGLNPLIKLPTMSLNDLIANRKIRPRGVMWDMATDPSLAVTVFHLLERVSVALPLGFLLMPLVQMMRNPLNGIRLSRFIPARASHRSVDYEELAKRIDMVDKILSRALRPSHRQASLSLIKR